MYVPLTYTHFLLSPTMQRSSSGLSTPPTRQDSLAAVSEVSVSLVSLCPAKCALGLPITLEMLRLVLIAEAVRPSRPACYVVLWC